MAGLQVIYYPKRKDDDPRGRKRQKGWRITMKTQGRPLINVFLSVKKYQNRDAKECKIIAESIEEAYTRSLSLDKKTTRRLDEYPDFKKALAEKGLVDISDEKTLFDLWNEYESANVDKWAPGTYENKRQRARRIFQYFPPETLAYSLTAKDAQGYRNWLDDIVESGEMAGPTANNYIKDLKGLFKWAIDNDMIPVLNNPFKRVETWPTTNPDNIAYLEHDDFKKLLDACPSQEWRVFLLLQRREGCRLGETQLIKWNDIEWAATPCPRLLIHSPKTKRHKGKDKRTAPLFPDVAEALRRLKEEQEQNGETSPHVLATVRGGSSKLGKTFKKIIAAAGLKPWPRIFQNLRAGASTDIFNDFGEFAESEWVGHGHDVAMKHYYQITSAQLAAAKNWNPIKDAKKRDAFQRS